MTCVTSSPQFGCNVKKGDKLGFKYAIKEDNISLYLNGKFIAIVWQNIPNSIVAVAGNATSNACYAIKYGEFN